MASAASGAAAGAGAGAAGAVAFDTRVPVMDGTMRLAVRVWSPSHLKFRQRDRGVIAWPGWLDNAGSFERLAPLLAVKLEADIVVVDPPGCGHSDHRPLSSLYDDHGEIPLVLDVADELGFDTFVLLGHSRGAGVVSMAAGAFSSRVRALVAIENATFGLSGGWLRDLLPDAPTVPERVLVARNTFLRNRVRPLRRFATLEEAIDASVNNEYFPKSYETARNIVMRHVRPSKRGGWTFIHDQRTYGQAMFVHLSEEQTRAFLSQIACPVLRITAYPNPVRAMQRRFNAPKDVIRILEDRVSCIKNLTSVVVEGGHHVHSDRPEETADAIAKWLLPIIDSPPAARRGRFESLPDALEQVQAVEAAKL